MGPVPGFFPFLVPGVIPGDGGQGDGGTTWTVPAPGEYTIHVSMRIIHAPMTAGDYHQQDLVANFGATTTNPFSSGFIPPGCQSSIGINSELGIVSSYFMNLACTIHAGCTGCAISVGDALTVHINAIRVGGGAPLLYIADGFVQVSRIK